MELNDTAREKMNLAKHWIISQVPGSQEWDSAFTHLEYLATTKDEVPRELRDEAKRVLLAYIEHRGIPVNKRTK